MNHAVVAAGGRYQLEANGLRIRQITTADAGEYGCRAVVESDGRYDERRITVRVHGKSTYRTQKSSCIQLTFRSLNCTTTYRLVRNKY